MFYRQFDPLCKWDKAGTDNGYRRWPGGCRPTRSANHFLTSPPRPGAEVREQLHRTAPTEAKTKIKIKRKRSRDKSIGVLAAQMTGRRCKHTHTRYPP